MTIKVVGLPWGERIECETVAELIEIVEYFSSKPVGPVRRESFEDVAKRLREARASRQSDARGLAASGPSSDALDQRYFDGLRAGFTDAVEATNEAAKSLHQASEAKIVQQLAAFLKHQSAARVENLMLRYAKEKDVGTEEATKGDNKEEAERVQ